MTQYYFSIICAINDILSLAFIWNINDFSQASNLSYFKVLHFENNVS